MIEVHSNNNLSKIHNSSLNTTDSTGKLDVSPFMTKFS